MSQAVCTDGEGPGRLARVGLSVLVCLMGLALFLFGMFAEQLDDGLFTLICLIPPAVGSCFVLRYESLRRSPLYKGALGAWLLAIFAAYRIRTPNDSSYSSLACHPWLSCSTSFLKDESQGKRQHREDST